MPYSSRPAPDLSDLWAKSTGETIGEHTCRVLSNLRQLRCRSPRLDLVCGDTETVAAPGDRRRVPRPWQVLRRLPGDLRGGASFRHRHEVLSVSILAQVLGTDLHTDLPWIAAAILTHHKDWPEIDSGYPYDPSECRDALDQLRNQFSPVFVARVFSVFRDAIWPALVRKAEAPAEWSAAIEAGTLDGDPVSAVRSVLDAVQVLIEAQVTTTIPDGGLIGGRFLRGAILIADHSGSAWESIRFINQLSSPVAMRGSLGLSPDATLHPHQTAAGLRTGTRS